MFRLECANGPRIVNSETTCDLDVGYCTATCFADYLFPNKQRSMEFNCVDGTWFIQNTELSQLPSCARKSNIIIWILNI